jgi:hypothetical protein
MSKPTTIKKPGQSCRRCAEPLPVGTRALWSNLPSYRGWLHLDACTKNPAAVNAPVDARNDDDDAPSAPAARTPAAPGSIDAIIDQRIDAALGGFQPAAAMDEGRVRALIAETQAATVTVEIKRLDETVHVKENAHPLFPRAARLAGAGVHLQFYGPAGTGKTTLAIDVAEALGNGWELETLDPTTPKSSVSGYRTPTGENVHTSTTRAAIQGKALILDENDLGPGALQSLYNGLLANGHIACAWGRENKASTFVHLGCSNTPLAGPTPTFSDRKVGSSAYRDRLYFIHVPQDPNIEARAAGLPLAPPPARKATTCTPAEWVSWVRAMRAWAPTNAPLLVQFLGQRASLMGVKLLDLGETPREMADGLVFKGADDALVAKALAACPLTERAA